MQFKVISSADEIATTPNTIYLIRDFWDDFFQFQTTFIVWYINFKREKIQIGVVKIGMIGMGYGHASNTNDSTHSKRSPTLQNEFEKLPDTHFSLGLDEDYYQALIDNKIRKSVMRGLNDLAFDLERFKKVLTEPVVKISLMRGISQSAVEGQLNRMANGGEKRLPFKFSFIMPRLDSTNRIKLKFNVSHDQIPPSNIYTLIGANGVGKTKILKSIALASTRPANIEHAEGFIETSNTDLPFTNLVFVSFNAFDLLEEDFTTKLDSAKFSTNIIGIQQNKTIKSPQELLREFTKSLSLCKRGPSNRFWEESLKSLEMDSIFKDEAIALLQAEMNDSHTEINAKHVFSRLSSGHKIVLLTLTKIIEVLEEKTLILLDEPETHLHPPLLSAFIRTLSRMLSERNGVAIIATHSPVILQEVPKKCIWKLRRSGNMLNAENPTIETFGENVGLITNETFGLEVSRSGFVQLLQKYVDANYSYEDILEIFNNEVGMEAKAIIRSLVAEAIDS